MQTVADVQQLWTQRCVDAVTDHAVGRRTAVRVAPDEEATSVGWGCKINKFCTFYTVNSLRAAPAAGRLPGPSVVGAYRRGAWGPLGPPGGPRLAADAPCGRAGGSARLLVSGASLPPPGAELVLGTNVPKPYFSAETFVPKPAPAGGGGKDRLTGCRWSMQGGRGGGRGVPIPHQQERLLGAGGQASARIGGPHEGEIPVAQP